MDCARGAGHISVPESETILVLLSSGTCGIGEVVDRSGFCWKSIQDVMSELAAGNLVSATDGVARGRRYYLNDPGKILQFLDVRAPVFAVWTNIYDSIGLLWQTCSNPAFAKVSEETFQNELKQLYLGKIRQKQIDSHHPLLGKIGYPPVDFVEIILAL